jgi:ubiquinone/menaquinone biosynthesis C-methylase UbiE
MRWLGGLKRKPTIAIPPEYRCPLDHAALTARAHGLRCSKCKTAFAADDGIVMLDIVQNEQRTHFDNTASTTPALTPNQILAGLWKAESFLDRAEHDILDGATILELGCGHGDLACGMATSNRVKNCRIFAFDHSLESLRVAKKSIQVAFNNEVYFSTQDAMHLCFAPQTFDLVIAHGVIHHILAYQELFVALHELLKPGGKAVMREPFAGGYVWACLLLKFAANALNVPATELGPQGEWIVQNISELVQAGSDREILSRYVDKHYFRDEVVLEAARKAGFRSASTVVSLGAPFYDTGRFMEWFMTDEYHVANEDVKVLAGRFYDDMRAFLGPELASFTAHAKDIVLVA